MTTLIEFSTDGDANGTSLQGYVRTDYDTLVQTFGEPELGGDKTTAEWVVDFSYRSWDAEDLDDEDYCVATIYDWKECITPMGSYAWHIGGRPGEPVTELVEQAIARKIRGTTGSAKSLNSLEKNI
jgi:hypothetical protein